MSDRTKAIEWWKSLSKKDQESIFEKWKLIDGNTDLRKDWPIEMIRLSSSSIQCIWQDLIK